MKNIDDDDDDDDTSDSVDNCNNVILKGIMPLRGQIYSLF